MGQIKHPSRLMDQTKQPPPVRFRAVIEMSLPHADPWDPTDYERVIEQWRKSLEENPTFNCKDVVIREILTVGPEDEKEYEKWRYQNLSHVHPGIRITTKAVAHRGRKKVDGSVVVTERSLRILKPRDERRRYRTELVYEGGRFALSMVTPTSGPRGTNAAPPSFGR